MLLQAFGQGDFTSFKGNPFRDFLRKMVYSHDRMIRDGRPQERLTTFQFAFDLTCGSGFNYEQGHIGTPLTLIDMREDLANDKDALSSLELFLCDRNEFYISKLNKFAKVYIARYHWGVTTQCMDNKALCPRIPIIIRSLREDPLYALGLVLIDPDGPESVPVKALRELFTECRHLDLAVLVQGTRLRMRFGRFCRDGVREFFKVGTLRRLFAKERWYIHEPMGDQSWSVLLGRSGNGIYSIDSDCLFPLDSANGRDVLRSLFSQNRRHGDLTYMSKLQLGPSALDYLP